MRITTERLALEPISLTYLRSTHAYSSDLENTRLMMFLPYGSIEETEAAIRESMEMWQSDTPEHLEFVILLGEAHIGGVTLYFYHPGEAELGWILDKRYWGHGYAAEAVRAAMEYGISEWGIRRFFAQCDSENAASYRLMERLGMRRVPGVGVRKNRSSDEERQELTYEIYTEGDLMEMRLYHTSDVEISKPDIRRGRVNADFGQGFYMTPDADFTYRWAFKDAVVNEYVLDLSGLEVRRFERSLEWFDYIFHNRRAKDTVQADVIIGPIANDTIFDTFGLISSGYLKPEDALELLMIGPEYVQVVVKTDRAARQLRWIGSKRVEDVEERREALKDERDAYDRLLAEQMEKIVARED